MAVSGNGGNIKRRLKVFPGVPVFVFLILAPASCFDARADIAIKRDGTGSVSLDYALSREFAGLGAQEGNRRWLPLPSGPADFERAAARIEGLHYRSGRLRERNGDLASTVRLDFDSPAALARFLEGPGAASYSAENGRSAITLTFLDLDDAPAEPGENFQAFVRETASGRFVEISFSAPAGAELSLLGAGDAPVSTPDGWILESGRRARFRAPLAGLLTWSSPLRLVIAW